jgi:hypothetical protein
MTAAMREFLTWVAFRPRTHAEAMEAWGSHCPRFTLWEDALDRGLVELDAATSVRLTAQGQAALEGEPIRAG